MVVTNNYRAGGGGKFPEIAADKVASQAPDTNRDVIVRFVHEEGTINPSADGNWSSSHSREQRQVFQSSPKAKQFLG